MRKGRVRRLDAGAQAAWDRFVETGGQASFFHLSGWKTVIEGSMGHSCPYLYVMRDGEVGGVLPLVHLRSRLFGSALVSTPFCTLGGPVAADAECLAELDSAARDLAVELGVEYLEYRLPQTSSRPWAREGALYASFRKMLAADVETAFGEVPRKRRAMIRKAAAAGLEGVLDSDTRRFYPLFAESVRNLGTPVLPRRYFEALLRVFGPACEVLTVQQAGRPLASVLSFVFRDSVLPYHGGGGVAGRGVAANDFMYWQVMRRAVERGLGVFDFGRSKRGTGAFAYKTIWGFEPEPLFHEYLLLRCGDIPARNPLNPKYRLAIAAWKRLPLPLANRLGPFLARNLG